MISLQILASDHPLGPCLQSFAPSCAQILVGDLGMTGENIDLCRDWRAEVVKVPSRDYAQARNLLLDRVRCPWVLQVEPWERLAQGGFPTDAPGPLAYRVVQQNTVSRQTRLWRHDPSLRFRNPRFETHGLDGGTLAGVLLSSPPPPAPPDLEVVNEWCLRSPTSPDPYYARAFLHLALGRCADFLTDAERYLFIERDQKAVQNITMIRYYVGVVSLLQKNAEKAVCYAVACLAANTLMSEFWCLLGDAHYQLLRDYERAREFYENAILLGKRRPADDTWPMDLSRYDTHPAAMLQSCLAILGRSTTTAISRPGPVR